MDGHKTITNRVQITILLNIQNIEYYSKNKYNKLFRRINRFLFFNSSVGYHKKKIKKIRYRRFNSML